MKPSRFNSFVARLALISAGVVITGQSAQAATGSWTGSTDANWGTATNWTASPAPGNLTGLNTEVATFNAALNGTIGGASNPIVIDSGRRIGGISFAAGAGAYVIGSNAGNTLTLGTRGPGYNGGSSTVVAAGVTSSQVIAAPITFVQPSSTNGQHGFVNNATDSNVTLTLSGSMTLATTRPAIVVLDGTNTGNNTISGNITFTGSTQGTPLMIKRGAGTWILSGTNTMTGTPATSTNNNNGIQVLDGVLSLRNNLALGSVAQVWVGNKTTSYIQNGTTATSYTSTSGGTLEVANGITLDNGLTLNLVNAGTLRSSGSNTVNSLVKLATDAGVSATISTVNSNDVFTLGNAANDLTGGAADTVIRISGPGTVNLAQSSNYVGSWSVNAGKLKIGNSSALGTSGALAFGAGSTGVVQLNGNSVSVSSLATNATVGSPIVENGGSGTSTLTVNSAANTTYAGVLQDGASGILALSKSGSGTLSLTGSSSYSGVTSVTGGGLKVNNSTGSATGTGAVTIGSNATLSGSGVISGAVTVNTGGKIAAGNSVGNLTLGSLTLDAGSVLDYEFNGSANDLVSVTSSNGLTINGGGLNLFSENTSTPWTNTGTYQIFTYNGAIGGIGAGALSVLNQQAGYSYSFGSGSGLVTLTISSSGVISDWNTASGGSWNTSGNWSGGVPDQAGASARFLSAATGAATVTLDGNKTVGGLTFDNANSYSITQGSGGAITLDSGTSGSASVLVSNGAHSIATGVTLASNAAINTAGSTSLSISGVVAGGGSITKSGGGTLDLSGANTYSGGTSVTGGTISFSNGSLGSGALGFDAAILVYNAGNTEDISNRTVTISAGGVIVDTNGNDVTLANAIGNSGSGAFTKSGSGKLIFGGANTYSGATSVTGGTLSISSNAALGNVAGGAALSINGATLEATDTISLDNAGANARALNIGSSGATISVADTKTLTVSGKTTASAAWTKTGGGTLVLAADNTSAPASLTSNITVNGGTLAAGGSSANGQLGFGTGSITLNNATIALNGAGQTSGSYGSLNNALIVPSGKTGTLSMPANVAINSTLTGAGTLNVSVLGAGQNFQGNWSAFTGQINLTGSGEFRLSNFQNNVFNNSKLNIGSGITVYQTFNPPSGAGTETVQNIGELSGAAGSTLGGQPVGGRFVNWTVGALNTSSTFSGTIQNDTDGVNGLGEAKLTKVGSGTLTLAGTSTYTGSTTVSAGTLLVNGSLGNTAVTVNNGGKLGGTNGVIGTGTASVTVNSGGTLAPGSSPGTLTINGSTTLNSGSTFAFEYTGGGAGASTDLVEVNGTLSINSATLTLVDLGSYTLWDKFTLFSYDSLTGTFSGLADDSVFTANGGDWLINYNDTTAGLNGGSGASYITITAVPEPGAALLGGLGVLALLRRRRN